MGSVLRINGNWNQKKGWMRKKRGGMSRVGGCIKNQNPIPEIPAYSVPLFCLST